MVIACRHVLFSVLLLAASGGLAAECKPPVPQPPHELALSMLAQPDAETFACGTELDAVRLTYFEWTALKRILLFERQADDSGILKLIGFEGIEHTELAIDARTTRKIFSALREMEFFEIESSDWQLPEDRRRAQSQKLLFIEAKSEQGNNLIWLDDAARNVPEFARDVMRLSGRQLGPFYKPKPTTKPVQQPLPAPKNNPGVSWRDPEIEIVGSQQEAPKGRPENILLTLSGDWYFELGERDGFRRIEPLYGSHALQVYEKFNDSEVRSTGFYSFDPRTNEYLSAIIHNLPGAVGLMKGRPADDGRQITFEPLHLGPGEQPYRSLLTIITPDYFYYETQQKNAQGEWVTAWRADFTRQR
ncbi:MAG: DUF1579 domain-containing protein [Gammaproteobacteria bacterium]|nr:DUF1579 domain-containing protein [Gammaproteobacteria bacterium]